MYVVFPLLSVPTKVNVSQQLGLLVLLRINGSTYNFLGNNPTASDDLMGTVNITDTVITPTQTVFATQAGPMQVNFTFLNPIEVRDLLVALLSLLTASFKPGDWVKQSIPFSYLALSAKSLDGAAYTMQVYSDVTGGARIRSSRTLISPKAVVEWNSGDLSQVITWSTTPISDVVYHTVTLQSPVLFNEIDNMAEWGSVYYAMKSVSCDDVIHYIAHS